MPGGKDELTLYRGEYTGNKGGRFFHPDREFARQFTQSGRDSEVQSVKMSKKDIYRPDPLPYGGDPDQLDAAIAEAKAKGFKALYADEGTAGEPSVLIFSKRKTHPDQFMPGEGKTFDESHDLQAAAFYRGLTNPKITSGLSRNEKDSVARHNAKVEILNTLDDAGLLNEDLLYAVKSWDENDAHSALWDAGEKRTFDEIERDHEGDKDEETWGVAKPLFDWVKSEHPETENIKIAGYVLPEGEMLSFSHDGRSRDQDHREITWPYTLKGESSGTGKMIAMMNAGAMRVDANSGNISLRRAPTGAQEKAIRKIVDEAGKVYIDAEIPGEDGYSERARESFEADEIEIDDALKQVSAFYKRGKARKSFMPGDAKRTWFMRDGKRVYHHRGEGGKFVPKLPLARMRPMPVSSDDDEKSLANFR